MDDVNKHASEYAKIEHYRVGDVGRLAAQCKYEGFVAGAEWMKSECDDKIYHLTRDKDGEIYHLREQLKIARNFMDTVAIHYNHPMHDHNWANYVFEKAKQANTAIEKLNKP